MSRLTRNSTIVGSHAHPALRRGDGGVLMFVHLNKGGTTVDHSLRLDVLAVCAVFVFVGAVLLGAF